VEQRKQRAVTAQQLLENPVLQEAFGAVEADLLRQVRACSLSDKDGHTRLVMAIQMSQAVNRHLWLLIQDGQAAQLNVRGSRID
jgi:ABC-type transport system involved in Fe-S cluster assembly fused permease/ATPase subunit